MGAHKCNSVEIGVPGANLYQLVQTCANMRKSLQIGAKLCKLVQSPDLHRVHSICTDFHQFAPINTQFSPITFYFYFTFTAYFNLTVYLTAG